MQPAPAVKPLAAESDKRAELHDRLAVSILLMPFVFLIVQVGGLLYLLAVLVLLLIAAVEFGGLFVTMRQRPARPLLVAGVGLLVAAEQFSALNPWGLLPSLLVLAALLSLSGVVLAMLLSEGRPLNTCRAMLRRL